MAITKVAATPRVTASTKSVPFKDFKLAVAKQFERMRSHEIFRTAATKDALWDTYLGTFPEGTNPIFRERTEHDCQGCKQFIRAAGNMVAIVDGKIESIWDVTVGYPYQVVADALSALVKAQPIDNIYLRAERSIGTDKNFEDVVGNVTTWEHFFLNLPPNVTIRGLEIGSKLSDSRATHDVLLRSLTEISDDAIETVLDLIAQNSLYRGEEHKFAVESFRTLKREFKGGTADPDIFVWSKSKALPQSVARIRNTVIGTLLVDLSEGKDMEDAVRSFEAKVAPTNYKRPTALITKKMIEQAREKITELGLMSALERRYAALTDITVNNILFADRAARTRMGGDVFDDLAAQLPEKAKNFDHVEEVTIEKFIADILPRVESVEVMFENRHAGNLVSLIAPVDPTAGRLLKWDNNFSWSYNGELADSIKERVKRSGGNVTGDLCCRLAWFNHDDLDLHMKEPGGYEIYYPNKGSVSPSGGMLDVDMNAGCGKSREPVENIFYKDRREMREGVYLLQVHQFKRRESTDVGFEVEMDILGTVHRIEYAKPVKQEELITVAEFRYSHKGGFEIVESLPSSQAVRTIWGVPTQSFHKVNVMMLSPNHWDGHGVGNKHYFFMVDGCVNDGKARGFFNEFLRADLDPHRKAFEIVGAKMQTEESGNQLSGLGFSSTQRNNLVCRVKGSFNRTLKIAF